MAVAQNGSVEIYYDVTGDGLPLLLLMGAGGTHLAWRRQVSVLAERHQVIVMDNRGAGLSSMPPGPYSMRQMADDCVAVMDAVGVDKVLPVGASMGSLIAQALYHYHPSRVLGLVLASSTLGLGGPAELYPSADTLAAVRSVPDEYNTLRDIVTRRVQVLFHPDYLRKNPLIVEGMLKIGEERPQPSWAYQAQLTAADWPNLEVAGEINIPVLIIHGGEDRYWPVEGARYLRSRIPGSRLVILRDAGHGCFLEQAEIFNRLVVDFVNRNWIRLES